jgi:hypothetical protein
MDARLLNVAVVVAGSGLSGVGGVVLILGIIVGVLLAVVALGAFLRNRRARSRAEIFRRRPHGRGRVGRIR